jgi:hypothetical protein
MYGQNTSINLRLSSESASYEIEDAKDTSEARSIEDLIQQFFKKHRVSRLLSPWVPMLLITPLIIGPLVLFTLVWRTYLEGLILPYRPLYLFGVISLIIFGMYIIWSSRTEEPPEFSFIHSIIYFEKPKSHALITSAR